jgi:hypothetical protein
MPDRTALEISISGIILPRLALPAETDALPAVLAMLGRPGSGI